MVKLLDALVDAGAVTRSTSIDSTHVKAQRAALGGKRGLKRRLKDYHRVATRYDKLARNYLSGVTLAALTFWM